MDLIEYYYGMLYGDESFFKVERVRNIARNLVDEYNARMTTENERPLRPSSQVVGSSKADLQFGVGYDEFLSKKRKHTRNDLDIYLEEDVLPRTSSSDILTWWKSNGAKFPILQAIARVILSIPVSTVASESTFSTGGRLVSPQRSSLHPETVEALTCTQNWLSSMFKEGSTSNVAKVFEEIEEDDSVGMNESYVMDRWIEEQ
ncbi:zinc finger BED domain-containing protein DAYSLEEPER-like [Canna indica]|uniref:Zinc finger BED domain-containing protein DAYSLEEPER-like n=1 Tax=Canna indica TaxID=4628 RepID=A0AAQ3KP82_9LILI|nr:zinc finger BED domain-containing protein DAYSLEEPER-like [Canna indica]